MSHSRCAAWAPTRRLLAVLAAASVAAACGGGGDGNDSGTESAATSAEGFYAGSMAGGTPNRFEQLVLENNEIWHTYGTQASAGAAFQIAGVVNGTGTYSGGTLTATAAKDFGVMPATTVTLSASYKSNSKSLVTSVSGAVTAAGRSVTLAGDNSIGNYRYSAPASPTELAGTWTLPLASGSPGTLSVNSTGGFSLNVSGCAASGTMVPRASGKNVFNVTMTFGAAPCNFPGVTFSGVAFIASNAFLSTGGQLRVLIRNGTQTTGLVFPGGR